MDVSSVHSSKEPGALRSASKASEMARRAFGPSVELLPVDRETLLQQLSEPAEIKTLPSYPLAARAIIQAAAAAKKE